VWKALKDQGIALEIFDYKLMLRERERMIDTYKITQTPTCILKYSNKYIKKFSDSDEIHNGLLPELETIENNSKK
jgi:hypothetical protein